MKRRNFLTGTVAVAAASILPTLPALAIPNIIPVTPDLESWKKNIFEKCYPGIISNQRNGYANPEMGEDEQYFKLFKALNTKLIDEHQDLFVHEPMYAPTAFREHPEYGSFCIAAKSRAFKTHFTHEFAMDLNAISYMDGGSELINVIVAEAAAELRNQRDRRPDEHMAFYIPIVPLRYVDPMSFLPIMGFKTRYGNANLESIYSHEYLSLYRKAK